MPFADDLPDYTSPAGIETGGQDDPLRSHKPASLIENTQCMKDTLAQFELTEVSAVERPLTRHL
jgi:hypothetical protein